MGYRREQQPIVVGVVTGASCDSCGKELDGLFDWLGGAQDSVDIVVKGGYGRYFDGDDVELVVCSECVKKLAQLLPRLAGLI